MGLRNAPPQPTRPGADPIVVGGPHFEDLEVGRVFDAAPGVTLTAGHAALHTAQFGDRMRLPLDSRLCEEVTGRPALAHPNLVCNLAIGQSTDATQRVKGNLFYRGLILWTQPFIGDTLRTRTEVVALRQNRPRPGRAATGLAVLRIHVENQRGETVMLFWRCPMLPCRDPLCDTGARDSLDAIPDTIAAEEFESAVPPDWRLEDFRRAVPGEHFADVRVGAHYVVEARDTVTCRPELARLTMNQARAHTDAHASPYGRRLVYGGHTVSMASAMLTRALPNLVTNVAWRGCDHPSPVFEGDRLWTEFRVDGKHRVGRAGGLVELHVEAHAERADESVKVLDWRVVALLA